MFTHKKINFVWVINKITTVLYVIHCDSFNYCVVVLWLLLRKNI